MSRELDRRIAVEVMGEPEPPIPGKEEAERDLYSSMTGFSEGGNWYLCWCSGVEAGPHWHPHLFSGRFETAMRAATTLLAKDPGTQDLCLEFNMNHPIEIRWLACHYELEANAPTLPEAICKLLLDLSERGK